MGVVCGRSGAGDGMVDGEFDDNQVNLVWEEEVNLTRYGDVEKRGEGRWII